MKLVKLAQVLELVQRVGGIGVHAQRDVGPAPAHFFQHVDVPARLHLELDPAIPRCQLRFDPLQQLLVRVLNPDRHAARNLTPGPAQQLPERLLLRPRFRIPERVLQRRFRHPVTANPRQQRPRFPSL